jgi:hypothetical protein
MMLLLLSFLSSCLVPLAKFSGLTVDIIGRTQLFWFIYNILCNMFLLCGLVLNYLQV